MFRTTGGDFILNKVILSKLFNGAAEQPGAITENPMLFMKNLSVAVPVILIDDYLKKTP